MRTALALAAAAALLAAITWATLREAGVTCEVCMEFEGRSACRSATGRDREAALYGARTAACSVISGGVTQGMQCDRTPPRSAQCEP